MPEKGGVMSKRSGPIILSALITLYFLLMSVYELWMAYVVRVTGDVSVDAEVVGWISFVFFLLGALCLLLTIREASAVS
jgi:hypothetical protein